MRTLVEDGQTVTLRYRTANKNSTKSFQVYDTDDNFEADLTKIIQRECQYGFNPSLKPYGIYCVYGNVKNNTFYTTADIDELIGRIKQSINATSIKLH